MFSKALVSFTCILSTLSVMVNSEVGNKSGQVPVDRCTDTRLTSQYFACKLDDCDQWISFIKCEENTVSTAELNMVTKHLVCKNSLETENNETQGLVPKSMCSQYFVQGDVRWCQYEHCWFAFTGCEENKTETGYLNFKLKALYCQPKMTASYTESTPDPSNSTLSTHTLSNYPSGQLSFHWNVSVLFYISFCIFVVLLFM